MDPQRRSIIVKEIEHWRQSRLLPDKYCDFLLNLYRDPETEPTAGRHDRRVAIVESHPLLWVLTTVIIGFICYLIFHFNSFPPLTQLSVMMAGIILSLGASAWFRSRKPMLSYLLFGFGSAVLLLGGLMLTAAEETGADAGWAAGALYIACCGVIWVVFGVVLRVPWIHLCGWAALVLAYSACVNRLVAPQHWFSLELCWTPLAALFGWAGWLFARRARQSGAVFLIMACLLWIVPEGYAFAFTDLDPAVTQAVMIFKVAALGAAAFIFRKRWTEWVV